MFHTYKCNDASNCHHYLLPQSSLQSRLGTSVSLLNLRNNELGDVGAEALASAEAAAPGRWDGAWWEHERRDGTRTWGGGGGARF